MDVPSVICHWNCVVARGERVGEVRRADRADRAHEGACHGEADHGGHHDQRRDVEEHVASWAKHEGRHLVAEVVVVAVVGKRKSKIVD